MARSLALALYLLAAGRRGTEPEPARADRPAGTLVWMHLGAGSGRKRLAQLARRLAELRPGLSFLVTAGGPAPPDAGRSVRYSHLHAGKKPGTALISRADARHRHNGLDRGGISGRNARWAGASEAASSR